MNTLVLPGPLFFFGALVVLGALAYALNRWPLLAGAIAAGGMRLTRPLMMTAQWRRLGR